MMDEFTVPPQQLQCAEYSFKINTEKPMGEKANLDELTNQIIILIVALMNTSGGIISVISNIENITRISRQLCDKITEQLKLFIPQSKLIADCVKYSNVTSTNTIIFTIWSTPLLITKNTFFLKRVLATTILVTDVAEIRGIVKQKSRPVREHVFLKKSYEYESVFPDIESRTLEMKCWKSGDKKIDYQLKQARLQKTLLAFANQPEGGTILLGLEENKRGMIVKGILLSTCSEEDFNTKIEETLRYTNQSKKPRYWSGSNKITPQYGKHWEITFIPIEEHPQRRLVAIQINHCPGGVFSDEPESYVINYHGLVERMSFAEWYAKLHSASETIWHIQDTPGDMDDRSFPQEQYMLPVSNSDSMETHSENSTLIQHLDKLSWSANSSRGPVPSSVQLQDQFQQMLHDVASLKFGKALTFTPSKEVIRSAQPLDVQCLMEQYLERLGERYKNVSGIAIAANTWTSLIDLQYEGVPPISQENHHLTDILVLDDTCRLTLHAVVNRPSSHSEDIDAMGYLQCLGRLIKRLMLQEIHSRNIELECDIMINCCLVILDITDKITEHFSTLEVNSRYEYTLRDTSRSESAQTILNAPGWIESVRSALGIILFHRQTSIKRGISDDILITLTLKQMEMLVGTDLSKFNFIEGPPGSGKSFMALQICKMKGLKKCIYICSNPNFENFVKFQLKDHITEDNESFTSVVQSDNDMTNLLERDVIPEKKYIIVDDSHRSRCSKSAWKQLYYVVQKASRTHLFIFRDNTYQNFENDEFCDSADDAFHDFKKENRGRVSCFEKSPMTEVHRNTIKVASFMYASMTDIDADTQITSAHTLQGDDVEAVFLKNLEAKDNTNGILIYLQNLTDSKKIMAGNPNSYHPHQVALLLDGPQAIQTIQHYKSLIEEHLGIAVQDAGKQPVTDMIMDKVDNFHGLDSSVVIFLTNETSGNHVNTISNPKYRVFLASRGIFRVVFVFKKKIDLETAQCMKLDTLLPSWEGLDASQPSGKQAQLKWHREETWNIVDIDFLRSPGGPALILYVCRGRLFVMTLDGREMDVPLETGQNEDIEHMAVDTGSGFVAITYVEMNNEAEGPWLWRIYARLENSWQKRQYNILERQPDAIQWTHMGYIAIINKESLSVYQPDGELWWRRTRSYTGHYIPTCLKISPSGRIYIVDRYSECIRVLDSDGRPLFEVPPKGSNKELHVPVTVNLLGNATWLTVGHDTEKHDHVVSLCNPEGTKVEIARPTRQVTAMGLYMNKLLAVGTVDGGLYLYDITDTLSRT